MHGNIVPDAIKGEGISKNVYNSSVKVEIKQIFDESEIGSKSKQGDISNIKTSCAKGHGETSDSRSIRDSDIASVSVTRKEEKDSPPPTYTDKLKVFNGSPHQWSSGSTPQQDTYDVTPLQMSSPPPVSTKKDSDFSEYPTTTEIQVANFVIDNLRVVEPTLASVSSCAISFQNQFGEDPRLILYCLRSLSDFFLCVDASTRLSVFYVLNDVIQRDPRFRLGLLLDVLPKIIWAISSTPDRDLYVKTVTVWEQRKIYPSEVCQMITAAFNSADIAAKGAFEYQQRLASFVDMARIRAAKDADLERLFHGSTPPESDMEGTPTRQTPKVATEAAIMAASTSELKAITNTARASLAVTQGTFEYLSRLLFDFDEELSTLNLKSMEYLELVLERASAIVNNSTQKRD